MTSQFNVLILSLVTQLSLIKIKTKLNIFTVFVVLFGIISGQNATAQAPNPHPAQKALKGIQPFIGNWAGKFEAFGGLKD